MPIHLTSRRSFLKGVVGAGAGWLLQGCSGANRPHVAGDASKGPATWAFVSDTHIHANPKHAEHGGRMSERFKRVLADILATQGAAAGMLINGDLVFNHGLPGDYAQMLKLLEPARSAQVDLHLVLGNHDDRGNFLEAFFGKDRPAQPVPDHYVSVVDRGGVRMILLDSLIRPNYTPGLLGPKQLRWLTRTLDAAPDCPTILFLHHWLRNEIPALQDERMLTDIIVPRRQVKAVIAGHSHEYRFREADGIYFMELPATGYVFTDKQPIGWVRARLDPQGCELELRAVAGNRSRNGEKRQWTWRADAAVTRVA